MNSAEDIDVHHGDLVGGNGLDVHAAFGGEHEDGAAGIRLGVDDDPGVVFLVDGQLLLDQDLLHQVSLDRRPQKRGGLLFGLFRRIGELHAARLAAPAGPDLDLDDHGLADLLRDLPGLLGGLGYISLGDRHLGNLEQRFTFMLI